MHLYSLASFANIYAYIVSVKNTTDLLQVINVAGLLQFDLAIRYSNYTGITSYILTRLLLFLNLQIRMINCVPLLVQQ